MQLVKSDVFSITYPVRPFLSLYAPYYLRDIDNVGDGTYAHRFRLIDGFIEEDHSLMSNLNEIGDISVQLKSSDGSSEIYQFQKAQYSYANLFGKIIPIGVILFSDKEYSIL